MLVTRDKLASYNINEECFFARRSGTGSPISRDQYFNTNSAALVRGTYCAIGDDENGWQLEQYNGANWVEVTANTNYSLIVTNAGLAALTDVMRGGYKLKISGIKIIDTLITNPSTPVINWTDTEFTQAGAVVFSCGTVGSPNPADSLKKILKWKFLTASGGLQYILTLPAEGFGAQSDSKQDDWNIGAVGLYVKSNENGVNDVLFAVGALPTLVAKIGTTVERIGNSVKIYLNTILSNLGLVSDLTVMEDGNMSLPEVANESLLLYPEDPLTRPYNCYVVDNLYGTGVPALAVPRALTSTSEYEPDWAYFQPTDNYIQCPNESFDDVPNYTWVYWDTTSGKYKKAEGQVIQDGTSLTVNNKMPVGIRVGNSVVYSGTVTNTGSAYIYSISIINGGEGYSEGDELLVEPVNDIKFKVRVKVVNNGKIEELEPLSAMSGNIPLIPSTQQIVLHPDPRSTLETGTGAIVSLSATETQASLWPCDDSWVNKAVYCDNGTNAGKPTLTKTDAFLGWCIASNQIRMALDLRNEASSAVYGTTRYATSSEVRAERALAETSERTAVTPGALKDNYLQTTMPIDTTHAGGAQTNPIEVQTYCKFNQVIIGKGCTVSGYNTLVNNDQSGQLRNYLSFYGNAYQAYWADLAEFYEADKAYEPGTLICFGGEKEITAAKLECNGVVSTKPGYVLGEAKSSKSLPVALCGRVPVLFDNECMPKTFDKVYISSSKPGYASTIPNGPAIGKIIQRDFGTSRLIECVVRLTF